MDEGMNCETLRAQIRELKDELERIRNENPVEETVSDCGEGPSTQPQGDPIRSDLSQSDADDEQAEEEEEELEEDSELLIDRLLEAVRESLNHLTGDNIQHFLTAATNANEEILKMRTILRFIDRIEDERARLTLKYEYLTAWIAENTHVEDQSESSSSSDSD